MDAKLKPQVDDALREIVRSLVVDGYALEYELSENVLTAQVTATSEACEDCLTPKEVMAQILKVALDQANLSVSRVQLRYPGESKDDVVQGTEKELTAERHRFEDLASAIEFCYAQGWTDGLPVIPATP